MMLYECGVRCDKTMENGLQKKVTEQYLVEADTFTEAEARITGEMVPYCSGNFDVITIKRTNITEVVEGTTDKDKWFKAKLNLVTVDMKTGKEKKQAVYFIVRASDINDAHSWVVEHMKGSVMDYEIATLDETKIVDLFRYNTSDNG